MAAVLDLELLLYNYKISYNYLNVEDLNQTSCIRYFQYFSLSFFFFLTLSIYLFSLWLLECNQLENQAQRKQCCGACSQAQQCPRKHQGTVTFLVSGGTQHLHGWPV